jgi:hypothetical protein
MNSLEESLKRLIRLAGTDEGFFVLALHAFIEAYLRADYPPLRNLERFPDLLWAYGDKLKEDGAPVEDLKTLGRIVTEHQTTNAVRHSFGQLDKQEVLAATFNFLRFCAISRIQTQEVTALTESLQEWEQKKSPFEHSRELRRIQYELFTAQRENRVLLARTEEWARDKQRMGDLDARTRGLAAELEKEKHRAEVSAERLRALRGQLNDVTQEKRRLSEQLDGYKDLDRYVEHASRFSLYTRTRRDYERSVMKLTEEQREAVDSVTPGRDHLIRGGAGTGKTIVLLHVLKRIRRARQGELDLKPGGKTVFLTYTNTLVKYDRYVAEILREASALDMIFTADSFFQARLRHINPHARVDYELPGRLTRGLEAAGMTERELAAELEEFLFANCMSRQEYLDEMVLRRGMRRPLGRGEREAVWAAREKVVQAMEREGAYSRNYARMKIIQLLEDVDAEAAGRADAGAPRDAAGAAAARLRDLEFALVDEAQDMSAADLRALKLMARRGLVMAGDAGQSIYGAGSPYRRAGVDISGRTRILRTTFRSTREIQELAERYRARAGVEGDEGHGVTAFRTGPAPELYCAASRQELAGLLVRKAYLFIEKLAYDPESLAVLAPGRADLDMLGGLLEKAGYACANIRDDSFTFKEEKTIRLSTLHSSKGLDFPVVLLFLPGIPARGEHDEREAERLLRNLLYVAMTRAMDNLNVFTLEAPPERPLQALLEVFAEQSAAAAGGLQVEEPPAAPGP